MPKKEEKDQKEVAKTEEKVDTTKKVKAAKVKEEKVGAKAAPKPVAKAPKEKSVAKAPKEEPIAKESKEEPAEKAPEAEEKEVPVSKEVADLTPEAKTEEKEVKIKKPAPVQQTWEEFEDENKSEYSDKERADLESLYGETVNTITEKQVIEGHVVALTNREVIVNIGFKSDGIVSRSEFRDVDELKPGDIVEVYIEEQENAIGQLVLSRRKAKIVKAWDNIQKALDEDIVIDGMVKRRTKGGLIVDVYGVEAFLPGSQIDVKPIRDFDIFVGNKMEVKVVKINYSNDNVVVSHKVLIEKDLEKQKIEILSNLEKGQVLEGVIKNMTNFGVFIDLGGVDGLLHITDISWGRINHPEDVLKLDEKVNIVVLDFDDEKKRISLGMKQLTPHPWDSLAADIEIGSKIKGKIVNVADYGSFLEIIPGVEGLIHVSEMSWSTHLRSAQDFVTVGDEVEAVILTLDRDTRKMSLGIKQITPDPWTDITKKYPVGSTHKGIVRNFTNFGVFAEMEEGIDGLIYISDLSWTKKIKHPSEFTDIGDELEVVVLELDVEGRKLSLGHKQTTENPWDKFQKDFALGTKHTAAISEIVDKGATINFNDEIVAFVPTRHLEKEDGTKLQKGEEAEFEIIEFNKEFKKVVASHMTIHKEEEAKIVKQAAKKQAKASDEAKPTLGDANKTLQDLKDKMDGKK